MISLYIFFSSFLALAVIAIMGAKEVEFMDKKEYTKKERRNRSLYWLLICTIQVVTVLLSLILMNTEDQIGTLVLLKESGLF